VRRSENYFLDDIKKEYGIYCYYYSDGSRYEGGMEE
jgi:hypothetical protein